MSVSARENADQVVDEWSALPGVCMVRSDWEAMSVVHFILVFRVLLKLEPHHLLRCLPERALSIGCLTVISTNNPEASVDDDAEAIANENTTNENPAISEDMSDDVVTVFDALIRFLANDGPKRVPTSKLRERILSLDFAGRIEMLKAMCEEAAERSAVRGVVHGVSGSISGKDTCSSGNTIPSGIRLSAGARDAKSRKYTWVRGMDGCASGRIELPAIQLDRCPGGEVYSTTKVVPSVSNTNHVVIEGSIVEKVAGRMEGKGSVKADRVCGAWLREKAVKAGQRASKVEQVVIAQRKAKEVLVSGTLVNTDDFGRGRRQRRAVTYNEAIDSDDESTYDVSEDDEEESSDNEILSSDESLDNAIQDSSSRVKGSEIDAGLKPGGSRKDDDFHIGSEDEAAEDSSDMDDNASLEEIDEPDFGIMQYAYEAIEDDLGGRSRRRGRRRPGTLAIALHQDREERDLRLVDRELPASSTNKISLSGTRTFSKADLDFDDANSISSKRRKIPDDVVPSKICTPALSEHCSI